MKRDIDRVSFALGWMWATAFIGVGMVISLLVTLFGCTPHAARIDVLPERVDETPQRVQDIQWPCERCGEPAKMCEVKNWYRCERCSRPKVRPKKLERQWVMR